MPVAHTVDGIRGPLFIRPRGNRKRSWHLITNDTEEQESIEEAYHAGAHLTLSDWRHLTMDAILTQY